MVVSITGALFISLAVWIASTLTTPEMEHGLLYAIFFPKIDSVLLLYRLATSCQIMEISQGLWLEGHRESAGHRLSKASALILAEETRVTHGNVLILMLMAMDAVRQSLGYATGSWSAAYPLGFLSGFLALAFFHFLTAEDAPRRERQNRLAFLRVRA